MRSLLFIFISLLSAQVFSATTGILKLRGVVEPVLSLTVNPAAIATNLDLATTQTNLVVAKVEEESNSNTGYKISISSLNDGTLLRNSGTETFPYTLKYDGAAVALAGTSTTAVVAKTVATGGAYSGFSGVEISYTGIPAANMVAGTYDDVLTLEIAAN